MYDLCATLPDDDVLCDSLAEYAQACREAGGSPGDWRAETTQCGKYLISYYQACVYDLCATLPDDGVLCDSLTEYAQACREAGGSPGDWRAETPQCGKYPISYHKYV